jgi:hypothetical protein
METYRKKQTPNFLSQSKNLIAFSASSKTLSIILVRDMKKKNSFRAAVMILHWFECSNWNSNLEWTLCNASILVYRIEVQAQIKAQVGELLKIDKHAVLIPK